MFVFEFETNCKPHVVHVNFTLVTTLNRPSSITLKHLLSKHRRHHPLQPQLPTPTNNSILSSASKPLRLTQSHNPNPAMPPKRAPTATPTSSASRSSAAARSSGPPARKPESGTVGSALRNTYDMLTAQENRSVLKAVGFAGVSEYFCFATGGQRGRSKGAARTRKWKAGKAFQ